LLAAPPGAPVEDEMKRTIRTALIVCLSAATLAVIAGRPSTRVRAQGLAPANGRLAAIAQSDLKEWLTYLASDALEGRRVYTEGYGLAAAYVAEHLKTWGLKPMGDAGYFQTVKLRSYRVTRNSSVTVEVNGQSRTFKHGDHVTFAANAGGRQTLTFNGAEFVGYGIFTLAGPQTNNLPFDDYKGRDVRNRLVVWLPGTPSLLVPAGDPAPPGGRGRGGAVGGNRPNYAVQSAGAAAVLSFAGGPALATPAAPTGPAQDALLKAEAALTRRRELSPTRRRLSRRRSLADAREGEVDVVVAVPVGARPMHPPPISLLCKTSRRKHHRS
jgi:hypothetical protein